MKKLESALRRCRKFYQTYEKQVRIAVIAIVVITALLLFGGNGENEEIVVEQNGKTQTEWSADSQPSTEAGTSEPVQTPAVSLVVDISGCVKKPGVYEVSDGTRLHQVIEEAGGLTKEADIDAINQAELVTDGQKILVPSKITGGEDKAGVSMGAATSNGKININQADSMALQEIPGVGPATAEKIIQYRESNGRFQSIEDIKNVSGIGDKIFEKMKDKISV
ncbi:MAG: ComEA family DNA-binding protein [Firmicutes bacterium]|nr:ComEA family DNA-binding protein [Bacillota bacterium]